MATAAGVPVVLANFASATSTGGNSFSAAASFPTSPVVREFGASGCGTTRSTVSVPAAGVAAGDTVVVRVVTRGGTTGSVTATDSQGNLYRTDLDVPNGIVRSVVLSAFAQSALSQSDTIDVSYPSATATSVVVDELSGIPAVGRVDAVGSGVGSSASPSATVTTTHATDLLLAVSGTEHVRTYNEAAGWMSSPDATTSCGASSSNLTSHAAYRSVSATGTYTYSPTLSLSDRWAAGIVAYKRP